MRSLLAISLLLMTVTPSAAQKSAQEKEWIAHCVSGISETNRSRARIYCKCMARSVDTSAKLEQTELERSFPPVHRTCFKKAGFRTPN
ncbi:MAG TPA: hypothetical protein PL193_12385 [Xanthobacteraceae bacterium]|nr:hypothetical protein [Xanthobacteraceae bacterium]